MNSANMIVCTRFFLFCRTFKRKSFSKSKFHFPATSASSNPRDEPPEVEAARNRKESVVSSPATMRVLNVLRLEFIFKQILFKIENIFEKYF